VDTNGKEECTRILVGQPEGNRPLGRPRSMWVENIKMHRRQVGMVWTGFIWLRRGSCEHGNELSVSIKCWEVLT
jgi:hypothetical protein